MVTIKNSTGATQKPSSFCQFYETKRYFSNGRDTKTPIEKSFRSLPASRTRCPRRRLPRFSPLRLRNSYVYPDAVNTILPTRGFAVKRRAVIRGKMSAGKNLWKLARESGFTCAYTRPSVAAYVPFETTNGSRPVAQDSPYRREEARLWIPPGSEIASLGPTSLPPFPAPSRKET